MDTIRLKANLVPKTQIENNEEIQPNLGGPIEDNLDEGILSIDNRWGFVYAKELKGYVTIGQKSGETLDSHATAEGYQVIASGPYSHAEGKDTVASGNCSHAEGNSAQAIEECSHAEGSDTQAKGKYSHAEGDGSVVDTGALGAHAEGHLTLAHGKYSHAEGENTFAYGDYSHAEGYGNGIARAAAGESSHVEGHRTLAGDVIPSESNSSQHAEGYITEAKGTYGAHSEGRQTKAQGSSSHAEGYLTYATGNYSHAEGYNNTAEGIASHVEGGELNVASGNYSHAEGSNTSTVGNYSHAEGYNTVANGDCSHVEGNYSVTSGQGSHAEGYSYYGYCPGVKIKGLSTYPSYSYELETIYGLVEEGDYIYPFKYSLEQGTKEYEEAIEKLEKERQQTEEWYYNYNPVGFDFQAWLTDWTNRKNKFIQDKEIAVNEFLAGAEYNPERFPTFRVDNVRISGGSTIIDFTPGNTAVPGLSDENGVQWLSFYLYKKNIASGVGAHAEGDGNKAEEWASHAEGLFTKASGANAHAEGYGCMAEGISSHAEGVKTKASGAGSHAQGTFTIASNRYASVLGCCNLLDPKNSSPEERGKYLEIVGNGDFNSKNGEIIYRSNARTLDWDGNQWNAGDMVIGPRDPKKENNIGIGSNRLKLEFSTDGVGTGNNAPKNKIGSWQLWAINKENNGTKNGLYIGYQSTGASSSTYDCWIDSTNRSFHTKGTYQTQTGNDYAECRQSVSGQEIKPGQVVCENGDGTLSLNIKRLQKGCEIVSDTYGFIIQPYEEYNLPIATSGRVLAYPDKDPKTFEIGAPVCAGENGTVSQMTEEEERLYPSRILGTVSEIPTYETWGSENPVKVNGRIWIRVK